MSTGLVLSRKSSEAELSEIFKQLTELKHDEFNNTHDHTSPSCMKITSPRRSVSFPSRSQIRLHEGNEASADEVLLSSLDQDLPSPRENGTVKSVVEDRISQLEKKVTRQEDDITLLKSALASALRRLSTVEENVKKPKGRMMPSIPTSASSSHPVRPSRHSMSSEPNTKPRDEENESHTSLSLVKGLLKTIRDKSPIPRHLTDKLVNTSNITSPAPTTEKVQGTSMENEKSKFPENKPQTSTSKSLLVQESKNFKNIRSSSTPVIDCKTNKETRVSPTEQPPQEREPKISSSQALDVQSNTNNSLSSLMSEVSSQVTLSHLTSTSGAPKTNDCNPTSVTLDCPTTTSARVRKLSNSSPTSEISSKAIQESSLEKHPTQNKRKTSPSNTLKAQHNSKSPRSSPTSEINSKATLLSRPATTSARARKLSDSSVYTKPRRKIGRASSEIDLSNHPRSRTAESLSLTPQAATFRRKSSTGGTNLRRSASSSSLTGKEENNNKTRDEPTRLYIRGRSLNLYPPSEYVEDRDIGLPPDQKLELEWVYGYRGRDCRDNLFYLPTGELVYNIAAVVILYNTETGRQRHYLGHNDDVKCVALHPNKFYIASGQVAGHDKDEGRPHVRIWNSMTLETLQVLGVGDFGRAISCLAFSIRDNGRHLIVVDEANEHVISYWEWENKRKVTETKGSSDPVLMIACHPRDLSIIVTCGKSHIAFWTVLELGGLAKKMGVYGKFDKPRFVLCICFLSNENLLSGDSNGNIFEWPQGTNHIGKVVLGAHEGPIFSLCALEDGQFLSGGGRDRLLILWNNQYQPLRKIELDESAGPVRSIACGPVQEDGSYVMAVGTTKNSVLQGTFDDGMSFYITGHTDELWGLAVHPTCRMFVTCGYDKQILMWNGDNHTIIWRKQLEESLQSAAFHPKALVLAIGTQSGKWKVLDSINGDHLGTFHDGPEQLDAIKYSPDGKYIAIGSHDNFIYLYTVSEDGRTYKRYGKLSGHSSFVTHLDWSKDSQYLQSNSGDYEILYWTAQRCKQVVSAYAMRDIHWETWTCVLGFPACGIWPEGADGTDINACCRSNGAEFLVTGDDFGQVNFFRFPVSKLKSDCQNCVGHSSHVTCVRFTCDDTRVISTGGKDCSVMQWKIVN